MRRNIFSIIKVLAEIQKIFDFNKVQFFIILVDIGVISRGGCVQRTMVFKSTISKQSSAGLKHHRPGNENLLFGLSLININRIFIHAIFYAIKLHSVEVCDFAI